jgi:hypothetical protein
VAARGELLRTISRPPLVGSRWTLKVLRRALDWLGSLSLGGLWRLLKRLGITWKRGRDYIHSPDPDYEAKLEWVENVLSEARAKPDEVVAFFLDEFTFYRQPTLSSDYCPSSSQPLARRSLKSNTATRLVAALNPFSGQVFYYRGSMIGVWQLRRFFKKLVKAHPGVRRIYLILDNWPVHFHPGLMATLEPQESPFPWRRPASWHPEAPMELQKEYEGHELPIQLIPLPTYAPWTNPIEKLWRKLRQEVLHLHRQADDLPLLRVLVDGFLDQYQNGSTDLLRYVGLLASD